MGTTLWGFPMYFFGVFCLILALIYAVQWPKAVGRERPLIAHLIMRWGHALVWLLLAASCFLWYVGSNPLGNQLAANAMILYLIFIIAFMRDKREEKNAK